MQPALSLDELATAWLSRRFTDLKAMPGLNNSLGSIQVESDVLGIKHPVFPPFSGSGEITGCTIIGQKHLAQAADWVKIRWKAYEIERECTAGSWFLSSRTALHPTEPIAAVCLTVTNPTAHREQLDIGFILSGRSRNTGNSGYAWAVPEVPTSVSSFNSTEGLYQDIVTSDIPGALEFVNDRKNGFTIQAFTPEPDYWERGQTARFSRTLEPGESITIRYTAVFHTNRDKARKLVKEWKGKEKVLHAKARLWWEQLWEAAFIPGNQIFSGHVPVLESSRPELLKLYYMAVLTALTCRRTYPGAAVDTAYITLWPRRGEGSAYLTWELPYISGLLSKLDPLALENMWKLAAEAPFLDSQVVNLLENSWGGWTCSVHPQGIVKGALDLQRWAGRSGWKEMVLDRKKKQTAGFEAASQNQITSEDSEFSHEAAAGVPAANGVPAATVNSAASENSARKQVTGWDAFQEALYFHRLHSLPGGLADAGPRSSYLECITDYAHGTAALTAAQIWALKESQPLTGADCSEESDRLLSEVKALYQKGKGYFFCRFPDGRHYDAPNLYDMGMVLAAVGEHLDAQTRIEIAEFARDQLITETWCHNLWPLSNDVVSGLRCDHQWAGCFPAWPAQFILGLTRNGYAEPWIEDWLKGMAKIPDQGPFGQAYWAEDIYPSEAGAAAKCFDELTQGNHWVILSGVHFFDMVVEGLLGIHADLDGEVSVKGGIDSCRQESSLYNLQVHNRLVSLIRGKLEL